MFSKIFINDKWYYLCCFNQIDVLSSFDKINVCVGYEFEGKLLSTFPTNIEKLDKIKPIYETIEGWKEDISDCRSYEELPEATKNYLNFISEKSETKFGIISVGPKRKETFFTDDYK